MLDTSPGWIDRYLDRKRREEEETLRKLFTCPGCGANLSEQGKWVAFDWSEGIPDDATLYCDEENGGCGREIEFHLEWSHDLVETEVRRIDPPLLVPAIADPSPDAVEVVA